MSDTFISVVISLLLKDLPFRTYLLFHFIPWPLGKIKKQYCLATSYERIAHENITIQLLMNLYNNWAVSSEFVFLNIQTWQISTAHAQPFRGARDLAFCLKVPLDSLLLWASSGGSGKTARMRRLAWTFAARIGDKYQIRLTRPNY